MRADKLGSIPDCGGWTQEGRDGGNRRKGKRDDFRCSLPNFSVVEGATPIVVTFVPLGMGWK